MSRSSNSSPTSDAVPTERPRKEPKLSDEVREPHIDQVRRVELRRRASPEGIQLAPPVGMRAEDLRANDLDRAPGLPPLAAPTDVTPEPMAGARPLGVPSLARPVGATDRG